MADPVTIGLAGIGTAASIIGGVSSASASQRQGESQKAMYDYRAGLAQINKQIADQNADYALRVGESQAQVAGIAGRTAVGSARAMAGASGLAVNSGSKANVITSTEMVAEQNQDNVRADAARRAYGFKVQGAQYTAQAGLDTMAGEDALAAGKAKSTATLLGTASSVSSKWLTASQAFGKTSSSGGDAHSLGGALALADAFGD